MESVNPKFALYGSKNKCYRTDTVFLQISQVCTMGVTLCVALTLYNMVFLRTFVLEYLLRDMERLNPEFSLDGSRNEYATPKLFLLITEVSTRTLSLLNTHNQTKYTYLHFYFLRYTICYMLYMEEVWGGVDIFMGSFS